MKKSRLPFDVLALINTLNKSINFHRLVNCCQTNEWAMKSSFKDSEKKKKYIQTSQVRVNIFIFLAATFRAIYLILSHAFYHSNNKIAGFGKFIFSTHSIIHSLQYMCVCVCDVHKLD